MKKFYEQYWRIPKNGKISDKAIVSRIAISVIVVLISLQAMCFSAYAYFSYNLTSKSNIIKAANFEVNVAVSVDPSAVGVETPVPVTSNYKSYVIPLKGGVTYSFTVTPSQNNTVETGFCVLTDSIQNSTFRYHTGQINNQPGSQVYFNVVVSNDFDLILIANWGTSSYYGYEEQNNPLYITNGSTASIDVSNAATTEIDDETQTLNNSSSALISSAPVSSVVSNNSVVLNSSVVSNNSVVSNQGNTSSGETEENKNQENGEAGAEGTSAEPSNQ